MALGVHLYTQIKTLDKRYKDSWGMTSGISIKSFDSLTHRMLII